MKWLDDATAQAEEQKRQQDKLRGMGVPAVFTGGSAEDFLRQYDGTNAAPAPPQPGSPGWYRNQQQTYIDKLQNPGLDNGLYTNAMQAAQAAQKQSQEDIAKYASMARGQGPQLGAQQVMAGQQQAAAAQNAMANGARGGMYNQAAMGQNATDMNSQGLMQARMQAQKLTEQNKVAGMGMYGNAVNATRDANAGMVNNAQTNAVTAANQSLGYQNLQDKATMGLDKIALSTSINNDNRDNALYNTYREQQKKRTMDEIAKRKARNEALTQPWHTAMDVFGSVGGILGKMVGG